MSRRRFLATAALVFVLVLAACSSGRVASAPPTTSAPGTTGQPVATGASTTTSDAAAPEVNPSGDIPDNQVFVEIAFPPGGFALKVPEGWARTDAGGTTTFTDKLNRIAVQAVPSPSAPTVASAQTEEVSTLATSVPNYEAGKVTTVGRPAGQAVLITYKADAPADAVTGKVVRDDVERYDFWRSGTEVVLTLSSPAGADNVDPWKTVTDSFRWT